MFPIVNRKRSPRKRQRPRLQPRLEGLEGRALLSRAGNLLSIPGALRHTHSHHAPSHTPSMAKEGRALLSRAGNFLSIPGALRHTHSHHAPSHTPSMAKGVFFDDFLYSSASDPALAAFGWTPRSGTGGPGNGSWSPSNVTFVPGPVNTVLQLNLSISGKTAAQAELNYNKSRRSPV